jgi:hypothetical protein
MTRDQDGNEVMDYEQTAKKTYQQYLTPGPNQRPDHPNLKVRNFPARLAVKETWEWNQLIRRVGEV